MSNKIEYDGEPKPEPNAAQVKYVEEYWKKRGGRPGVKKDEPKAPEVKPEVKVAPPEVKPVPVEVKPVATPESKTP
jgi:hypothetical protein